MLMFGLQDNNHEIENTYDMLVGMDKFLIRKLKPNESSSTGESVNQLAPKCPNTSTIDKESEPSLK